MKRVQSQQAFLSNHTADHSPVNHDDVGLNVDAQPSGAEQGSESTAAEEVTVSYNQYMSQVPTYYMGAPMVSPNGYYLVPIPSQGTTYPQRFNFSPTQNNSTQSSPTPVARFPLPGL